MERRRAMDDTMKLGAVKATEPGGWLEPNLVLDLEAVLAFGVLRLRMFKERGFLTIQPADKSAPWFKKEYQYWQVDLAERDFEAIRSAAGSTVMMRRTA